MSRSVYINAAVVAALIFTTYARGIDARQEGRHPHGHDSHAEGVDRRGDRVMGFDHKKTTHRFLLQTEGGAIEVTAKDAADRESRDQIRKHLKHIAKMFAEGDFNAPMLIHERVPPGVPVMKRLKAEIGYRFEEIERGGRVSIRTENAEAVRAVHDFLRFQIEDHRTGDSTEVKPR